MIHEPRDILLKLINFVLALYAITILISVQCSVFSVQSSVLCAFSVLGKRQRFPSSLAACPCSTDRDCHIICNFAFFLSFFLSFFDEHRVPRTIFWNSNPSAFYFQPSATQ